MGCRRGHRKIKKKMRSKGDLRNYLGGEFQEEGDRQPCGGLSRCLQMATVMGKSEAALLAKVLPFCLSRCQMGTEQMFNKYRFS